MMERRLAIPTASNDASPSKSVASHGGCPNTVSLGLVGHRSRNRQDSAKREVR